MQQFSIHLRHASDEEQPCPIKATVQRWNRHSPSGEDYASIEIEAGSSKIVIFCSEEQMETFLTTMRNPEVQDHRIRETEAEAEA